SPAPRRVRALRRARRLRRRAVRPSPALEHGDALSRPDLHHARDARHRRRDESLGCRRRRGRRQRRRLVPGRGGERRPRGGRDARFPGRDAGGRRRGADGPRAHPPSVRADGGQGSDRSAPRPRPNRVRPVTDPNLDRLRELVGEVDDLRKAATLLFWDQRVMMPPGGAQARADASATVGRLAHEKFVSPELGKLLDGLNAEDYDYDSFEASLIRVTRRDHEKAVRVPPELTGEMRRSSALALSAWGPAKQSSDFKALLPHLERNLELRHRYVECFPPPDETYDVLLDDYEPLMKTAEVRGGFDDLKQELVPLIQEIGEAGEGDASFLEGEFDVSAQREFSMKILRAFGYTDEEWRLDQTAHPFMTSPGGGDIRLTTNFRQNDLSSIFGSM